MKRMCLLLVIISSFHLSSTGQKGWLAGIKGGISIPHLRAASDGSYSNGYETVIGPQAGILAEYRFSPLFSLQTEFNYSTQGGEKKGDQRIPTKYFKAYIPAGINLPNYIYATFNNKISLEYLELPVMVKFSFKLSHASRVSVLGGPYIGYLLKGKSETSGQSKIYTDPAHTEELKYNGMPLPIVDLNRNDDIIDMLQRTNYGWQGGVNYEYSQKKYSYFTALGGTYGFRRLQKDPNFGDNQTGGLTISLGIMRKL